MNFELPVASNFAPTVDHIMIALLVLSAGMLLLVFGLMVVFSIRYRAGSTLDRGSLLPKTWRLETAWTTAIFLGFFGLFYWGAVVYVRQFTPPDDAIKISVVGKQWMWKIEHPGGQKEINTVHVPIDHPVEVIMTSEDVIHDFAIPAFRMRYDVLPGRYLTYWFTATIPGDYDLFCDQLCGANHSLMRGRVIAMTAPAYQRWLEENGTSKSLVADGKALFVQLGCAGCHGGQGTVRAPSLAGIYRSAVPLSNGTTVVADEKYLRDSILFSKKQVVASFQADNAVLRWQDQRRRPREASCLHQVPGCGAKPMSSTIFEAREIHESYLASRFTLKSWLVTTDHKRLAVLYLISITFFFFIGSIAAAIIRWNLIVPQGMLRDPETYNRMFSLHGVMMVWFFLVPSIPVTLGNFCIPLMIGARDVAFPKINLLSWYIFVAAGLIEFYAVFVGGVDAGWTFYPTLSTGYSNGFIKLAAAAIFLVGFSSIATGVNFMTTIHRLRAPGMTWHRLPVFIWSHYAVSVIYVLATPMLAMTMVMLFFERQFHGGMFDPQWGGDLVLYQHMFWFYSHPAVYIMILPGFGVISEIIPCFCHRKLFGYEFVVWCSIAIAVIGFFAWGHHMFVAGMSLYSALVFSLMSYVVAVPSAIKVFNWVGTMHKGFIRFDAPMLYALGFIVLFTIGGLTGLWVANLAADVHLHDTYFIIAHFHYIMVGGMVSAFFGGLHFWWPKITGRLYPEMWGRASGDHNLYRLQYDIRAAIRTWLYRNAAPLRELSAEISGAECNVLGRRFDPRAGIPAAVLLPALVPVPRRAGIAQSVGRHRSRMANTVAAAREELLRNTGRHPGSVRIQGTRGAGAVAPSWLSNPNSPFRLNSSTKACFTRRRRRSPGCGCSWRRSACSSAGCS